MLTNRWVETSRSVYAAFLALYPQEHRAEYGDSMRQVFTDQCRSAHGQKGALGIVLLWLRTLPDLGYTALLEHITSPRVTWGLMEPVPNAPLPWKGVFLILLPGLVYLASQVAQLITGDTWFYFIYYRITFLLIIPPLIAWIFTRRFPLWGLIPLGLFYRVTQEIGYQLIVWHPQLFSGNQLFKLILNVARQINDNQWFLITPIILAILLLTWRYIKKQKPSRSFWLWLGIYILVIASTILKEYLWLVQYAHEMPEYFTDATVFRDWFMSTLQWILYPNTALLLLIFIGTFFTRKHGFFAILILVGYIIPTTLMGSQNFEEFPNPTLALVIFSAAILSYRLLLTLIAPIWMSRTSSQVGKKRIVLISIAIALAIHAVTQFYPIMLYPYDPAMQISPEWILATALEELKLISAIALGVVMYQKSPTISITFDHISDKAPELITREA
jgi:hypothetical protein